MQLVVPMHPIVRLVIFVVVYGIVVVAVVAVDARNLPLKFGKNWVFN